MSHFKEVEINETLYAGTSFKEVQIELIRTVSK